MTQDFGMNIQCVPTKQAIRNSNIDLNVESTSGGRMLFQKGYTHITYTHINPYKRRCC